MGDETRNFNEIYNNAIRLLRKNIIDCIIENTIIVTIPRKGPRLIELLQKDKEEEEDEEDKKDKKNLEKNLKKVLAVCSEHSLPFLFADKELVEKIERVIIVDDAVYYGTTITGVYNLVYTYKTVLNAKFEIVILAGIKDSKANIGYSKNIFKSYETIPNHFGYYYIKKLSRDLSTLNSTLEIEFPTFTYQLTCPTTENNDVYSFVSDRLKNLPGCTNTYIVDNVNNDKKKSVTALFDTKDNPLCSFRKCRFNVQKKKISNSDSYEMNITVLSPFVLSDETDNLKDLFEAFPNIQEIWTQLTKEAIPCSIDQQFQLKNMEDSAIMFGEIERLRKRSIIIAANYIASTLFFMQIKNRLENNLNVGECQLKETDFYNIFGETNRSKELLERLKSMIRTGEHTLGSITPDGKAITVDMLLRLHNSKPDPDRMVFEKNYPQTPYTLSLFRIRVDELISKSANTAEAVSALFFLQNGLIEKHTRKQEQFNYYRLFFGQTFASIRQYLTEKKFQDDDMEVDINRLVDLKIDQCNVVPQYILDNETKCWRRVFRPGENEDYYLSHMARFVIMVHQELTRLWGINDIPEYLFEDFLIYLTREHKEDLKKDLCIEFENRNGKLFFQNKESGKECQVLDYLKRMKILEISNEFVEISENLADESLEEVTTLDRVQTENPIKEDIANLVTKIKESKFELDTAYMVLNAYIIKSEDIEQAKEELEKVLNDMEDYLNEIKNSLGKDQQESPEFQRKKFKIVINSFRYFSRFLADPKLVKDGQIQSFENKLLAYKELYNLVISIYLYKNPNITNNLLDNLKSSLWEDDPKKLKDALKTDFQTASSNAETVELIMECFKEIKMA